MNEQMKEGRKGRKEKGRGMKNFAAAQQEPGSARDQKGAAAMASSSPASSSLHAPYQAHKKQLPSGSSTTTSGASSSLAGGAGGSGSAGAVTTASSKRKRRLTDLTPEEVLCFASLSHHRLHHLLDSVSFIFFTLCSRMLFPDPPFRNRFLFVRDERERERMYNRRVLCFCISCSLSG